MKLKVFISYSHKDTDFARQLVNDIKPFFQSVWFDEASIRAGRNWDDAIEEGIKDSNLVLCLLSPNLLQSKICKDEFDNADRLGKPIIPILITTSDNSQLWLRIARRQWIDFRTDYSNGLKKLFEEISHLGNYRLPLAQKCPLCEATSESDDLYCPHCHAVYLPTQLSHVYTLSPQNLQKYLNFYQPRMLVTNAGIDDLIAVAIIHLVMESYDTAKSLLQKVFTTEPTHSYAWYLLALAELKGKRPRLLTRTSALEIQEILNKAITYNNNLSQAFLLIALLKEDFFEAKGFKIDNPTISACIAQANRGILNRDEIHAMIKLVVIPEGKIIQVIHTII